MVRIAVIACLAAVLGSACAFERIPEAPANAAIQYVSAVRMDDIDEVRRRTCSLLDPQSLTFDDRDSFGDVRGFIDALADRSGLGGESEYPLSEQVDLEVDTAWTEMILTADGQEDQIWRLHMVREDGRWKVCQAELRR